MTLEEFRKEGFIVGRPFEVEGKSFWIEKCMGGRFFCGFIGEKQITRATADKICRLIEEEVRR